MAVLATNSGKPADYFVLPSFLKHSEAEMSRERMRKAVEERIVRMQEGGDYKRTN